MKSVTTPEAGDQLSVDILDDGNLIKLYWPGRVRNPADFMRYGCETTVMTLKRAILAIGRSSLR